MMLDGAWFLVMGVVIGGLAMFVYSRSRISNIEQEIADRRHVVDAPVPDRVRTFD